MSDSSFQYFQNLTLHEQKMWDAPYLSVLKQSNGHLDRIIYSFFRFLHRHSDLFVIPDEFCGSNSPFDIGFLPGDAENLILNVFHQFDYLSGRSKMKLSLDNFSQSLNNISMPKENRLTVPKIKEVKYFHDGRQLPINGGGTGPNYTWSQTSNEVIVNVSVMSHYDISDIVVIIKKNFISIKLASHILLQGSIIEVKRNECTWSYEGNEITIMLVKKDDTLWESVFCGDIQKYKIDTSNIKTTRTIAEYDDDTIRKIRQNINYQRCM